MNTNKIKEYIMVKDKFSHAKLEEVRSYNYYGELKYTDHVYDMLNKSFRMDSLITEASYVIAFDHSKMPKGICKVGQGGLGETPTPIQPIFTFLLLTGASSFIIVHNHISNLPQASESDKSVTNTCVMLAAIFGMEFIGHMIINPNGYIIDGGTMDGTIGELDEDGDIISRTEDSDEFIEDVFKNETAAIHVTSENVFEVAKKLRERAEGKCN